VFCDDGRVVDEKDRDGGWRWEGCREYQRIWEIMGMTCLIGLGRPRIGVITRRIGTRACRIGDCKLTRTQNSLKSQLLIIICPISSHLSLSRPQLYHHLRTWSWVIPLYLSMPWSRVNTEYSIQWVLHTPRTASCQHRLSPAPSESLISWQTMLYSILYIPTIMS